MNARETALALLDARASTATVCPSEVARAIAAAWDGKAKMNWRDAMPAVHAAVDQLVEDGLVCLSWKGRPLEARIGPYRISRGDR
jgi:hypothetical protein